MTRQDARTRVVCAAVALATILMWLVVAAAGVQAQASPTITLTSTAGPGGTPVTVAGPGFLAGDTVLIEILGPSRGIGRLATVTAGAFTARVTIPAGSPPEAITIIAFLTGFQVRAAETVNRAPRTTFLLTGPGSESTPPTAGPAVTGPGRTTAGAPAALPRTGAGRASRRTPRPAMLGGLVLLLALAGGRSRRTRCGD